MMIDALSTDILASLILCAPLFLLALMGIFALMGIRMSERVIAAVTGLAVSLAWIASTALCLRLWLNGQGQLVYDCGHWIALEEEHFHFHLVFLFDQLSLPFLLLSLTLCGLVAAFATRYLHREQGYQRYFLLYAAFTSGMVISSVAGTAEVQFFGWELVGLSSALLVGFFHERPAPVDNGLRIWSVYRLSDAAFLLAVVVMHHLTGEGDWNKMTDGQHWPLSRSLLEPQQALVIGLLLLMAVMGKSALVPLSGWLPRAMEGPTASSAIFYGALSVHLGAYLLLRIAPIIAASPALAWIIVLLGATTAAFANMVQRVQADIKSLLAFASLTQVGLIVAEIGMGWTWFPLVHLLGHAILRTVQLLRAPSLLQDYWHLESALGQRIAHRPDRPGMNYSRFHIWLYRFSLQRGFLDSSLDRFLVAPIISQLHRCCNLEQVWTRWLTGRLMKTFQWNHLRPLLQAIIPDKATLSEGTNLPASVASSLDPIQTGQSPAVMPNDSEST